uniref:Uncharacterized protein n=1 Tax=Anguilla anguilla TaxID=7936 RepID=A0A0E9X8B9_ANGAN
MVESDTFRNSHILHLIHFRYKQKAVIRLRCTGDQTLKCNWDTQSCHKIIFQIFSNIFKLAVTDGYVLHMYT